jgi:hypothetical protein
MIEHAGPELFRLDEVVRRVMQANQDPREVIADRRARYFGAELGEDTLIPDEGAIIGVTRFDDWLKHVASSRAAATLEVQSMRQAAMDRYWIHEGIESQEGRTSSWY